MRDERPDPTARRLWLLVGGLFAFSATFSIASIRLPNRVAFGQDFMAFYSAGRLVLEGRGADAYDLAKLAELQRTIAESSGFAMQKPLAPFFNPPFVATLLAPLALLPFRSALLAWSLLNLSCAALAGWRLSRVIGEASPRWSHRALPVALAAISPPALASLGHGQNAGVSLLLLALAALAWRERRAVAFGCFATLLAYKPQLAAIVLVAGAAGLGGRALLGAAIAGVALLALCPPAMLAAFVGRSPANLQAIFFDSSFGWERHVTLYGFARELFHGNGPGASGPLAAAFVAVVGAAVLARLVLLHAREPRAGRRIAATILATPLLVPYFVDYDLLLLCVPATLLARERADRGLLAIGAAIYAWLPFNAIVAAETRVGATTLLLVACAWRATRVERARATPASHGSVEALRRAA